VKASRGTVAVSEVMMINNLISVQNPVVGGMKGLYLRLCPLYGFTNSMLRHTQFFFPQKLYFRT
jgi:hypothetical protein